jgi:16S rRNA (guanine527-N7)-methyltransferase
MTDGDTFAELLRARCAGFAVLSDGQVNVLHSHYEEMLRWNKRLNLTRIIGLEEAVTRHYAESLFLASLIPVEVRSVADIGSGAGFPGFPVAVLHPEMDVSLVESDQRKAAFLREAGDLVRNVRVMCVRGEDLTKNVDAVVGRAVRPAEILTVATRLSQWVGILLSRNDAEALSAQVGGRVVPLPWDSESAVLSADVPRGTSPLS